MQAAPQRLGLVLSRPENVLFSRRRAVRLSRATLAIANRDGKNVAVTVPAGAYIEVADLSTANRLVEVEWEGEMVQMFAVDVHERGELVAVAS